MLKFLSLSAAALLLIAACERAETTAPERRVTDKPKLSLSAELICKASPLMTLRTN